MHGQVITAGNEAERTKSCVQGIIGVSTFDMVDSIIPYLPYLYWHHYPVHKL